MTCPSSLHEQNDGPAEIDPAFLARLSDDDQRYITDREAQWEDTHAADTHARADALEACADYNRRQRQATTVSHETR